MNETAMMTQRQIQLSPQQTSRLNRLIEIYHLNESQLIDKALDILATLTDLLNKPSEKLLKLDLLHKPRRQWREIVGTATYPLVGEDAQTWVSRNRLEGDAQRELQGRGNI